MKLKNTKNGDLSLKPYLDLGGFSPQFYKMIENCNKI